MFCKRGSHPALGQSLQSSPPASYYTTHTDPLPPRLSLEYISVLSLSACLSLAFCLSLSLFLSPLPHWSLCLESLREHTSAVQGK